MKRKTTLNLVLVSIAVAIALMTAVAFWFYHSPYGPTVPIIRTDSSTQPTFAENRPIRAQPNRQAPALRPCLYQTQISDG